MDFGTALAGYGRAQPQIQQLQEMQQQKQQQAGMAQAMQRYQAQQQQQNPGQSVRPPDPMQMMDMLSKSGLPEDQQGAIWERYTKEINPVEKLQNQLEMGQAKITAAQDMLEEKTKTLLRLQGMRDATSSSNTDKRVGAMERGQDIGAENVAKRVGATERGQDIASTDRNRGITQRAVAQEENIGVKRQNADTATDRANTSKESMLLKDRREGEKLDFKKMALKEKNDLITRGQDKTYQAKMASIATRGTPAQKAEFDAAKSEFVQASADYRNAKISLDSSTEDIEAQADKTLAAQQKMEAAAAKVDSAREPAKPVTITAEDYTPENLEHTAKVNGITVDEVKKRLGIQ